MKRFAVPVLLIGALVIGFLVIRTLTGGADRDESRALVFVWYPNESTPEREASRRAIIELISQAINRPIEQQLTTDYAIAIEALTNGQAALSWMGAQAYVTAAHRQSAVDALVVHTEADGSLDAAKYYAMIGVNPDQAAGYHSGESWSLANLRGKRFSFVSNSSTSGFVVPSSNIASHFNVLPEDLLEGGHGKVFSDVLFGGSHQGALLNVLQGRADAAAYCNTCVAHYIDFVTGDFSDPRPGDVIRIRADAAAPFDRHAGRENVLIATVPVLNEVVAVNRNLLTDAEVEAVRRVLTSDSARNNRLIFGDRRDPQNPSFFQEGQMFVAVQDAWYNPVRAMTGLPTRN